MKRSLKPGALLSPLPAVLVSCGSMEENNLITIAWTGIINTKPPMVYISINPSRYSHDIVAENGCFVINLVNEPLVKITDWCGVRSGRDHNKAEEMGLHLIESGLLHCPMVEESPCSLECRVTEIKPLGSHDMFLAEIVGVYADEKFIDENGRLALDTAGLVNYSHGEYFAAGKKLGRFGYSVMKKKRKKRTSKNAPKK